MSQVFSLSESSLSCSLTFLERADAILDFLSAYLTDMPDLADLADPAREPAFVDDFCDCLSSASYTFKLSALNDLDVADATRELSLTDVGDFSTDEVLSSSISAFDELGVILAYPSFRFDSFYIFFSSAILNASFFFLFAIVFAIRSNSYCRIVLCISFLSSSNLYFLNYCCSRIASPCLTNKP